jgi:TPR repeat protein
LLILGIAPARADTAAGLAAMQRHNYIRALIEFEDPAKAGDPVAEANLGVIFHYGLGVSADFGKAARWYHAAALQGNIDGALGLAVLYTTGQGVAPDFALAHMWLSIAAEAMPPSPDRARVEQDRDAIAQKMTPQERQQSDQLLAAWYGRHVAP